MQKLFWKALTNASPIHPALTQAWDSRGWIEGGLPRSPPYKARCFSGSLVAWGLPGSFRVPEGCSWKNNVCTHARAKAIQHGKGLERPGCSEPALWTAGTLLNNTHTENRESLPRRARGFNYRMPRGNTSVEGVGGWGVCVQTP